VFLQIGETKVVLQQRLVAKVDKAEVALPFIKLGVLSMLRDGDNIMVRTNIGVKLTWDGNNFLEVSVAPSFKHKLCGLCGNYNGDTSDDFQKRRGKMTTDVNMFGSSWRVGSRRLCGRPERARDSSQVHCFERNLSGREQIRAVKECSYLKSPVFAACHTKVSHVHYFRSCLMDSCECARGKQCYCQAFKAYARECSRAGIAVDWFNSTTKSSSSVSKKCGFRPVLPIKSNHF